jgi:spore maturation protein CgeB
MANHHRGFPYTNARKRLIKDIGAAGIDIHVYGAGWPTPPPENVTLHPYVGEEDFARACSRSKIVLGYSNFNVRMYTSWRRVVNTMSSGAFYLTDYFGGIETVFLKGYHLEWFRGIPQAIQIIQMYLNTMYHIEGVAQTGRARVLARHTWDNRVAKMMEDVEGLDG